MTEPLPSNPYDIDTQSDLNRAYARCLDLESRHTQVSKHGTLEVLVCARFLGYMILEAPTDVGRKEFATEVIRCLGADELQKLAEAYKDHILRVFYSGKSLTPTSSDHSSVSSSNIQNQRISQLLVPSRHGIEALERDGYHCLFSGEIDLASLEAGLVEDDGSIFTVTEAAPIFARSTNQCPSGENKMAYATSSSAALARFGQIDALTELNNEDIYQPENILTLSALAHKLFDKLQLWLEKNPADPINHYKVGSRKPVYRYGMLPQIVLENHGTEDISLPDSRYLALHAACARVAHLSGAGEYINKVLRDIEELGVLTNDGSSDALYHALVRRLDLNFDVN